MKHTHAIVLLSISTFFLGCNTTIIDTLDNNDAQKAPEMTILKKPNINNLSTIKEASDLAFDEETNTLYIVGDKGDFYVYDVTFENNFLNLSYHTQYKVFHPNKSFNIDSEGLTTNNKNELIISFEGTPRISDISIEGVLSNEYTLPQILANSSHYTSGNTMLESVAWHEQHGILTAAEDPLKTGTLQSIYTLDGKKWHFKPETHKKSAITAIEVMDDNNLLILERAFQDGLIPSFYITLKKLYLNDCVVNTTCKTEVLYSNKMSLKNYEGLTKIGKNRYLMVTDNQNKIDTEFIYFEVK